jgi:formylglycine-generating enzyme
VTVNSDMTSGVNTIGVSGTGTTKPLDTTPPTISAFTVSPTSVGAGGYFTVFYSVADSGGSGLKKVVLRRTSGDGSANDPGWQDILSLTVGGNADSEFVSDTPPSTGTYWYGMAVFDGAGNYSDERAAGLGPLQRTVIQATVPAVTSPAPGSTMTSSSATFQWSSGTGVSNYWLYVGITVGASDIYFQYQGPNLSATVNVLPQNGSTLYVRLAWEFLGGFYTADYTYAAYTIPPMRIIALSGNLTFGTVAVGSSSQSTLTIYNTGSSAMTVSNISYPNGFSGNWSGIIAAGSSQPVTVTFSPVSATSYGGTVTVNSDMTSGVNTIGASGTGRIAQKQLTGMSLSDGMVRFVLNGPVGSNYVIQASSSLVNWLPVSTNTIPASGFLPITTVAPADQDRQFYRAVPWAESVPTSMVLIPAGSFTMGNCMDPSEGDSDELPLHPVYVSAFYMEKYLVTKSLWDTVYQWAIAHGYTFDFAGSGKAANHPVQTIDWYDCVKWCNARSEMEGRVPAYYTDAAMSVRYRTEQVEPYVSWSTGYRLPTEAEWEKAARGGVSGQRFPWGDTISWSQANYYADPLSAGGYAYDVNPTVGFHPTFAIGGYPYTSPVGYFAANGYGLYDMSGNAWQWCWDWYDSYASSSQSDPGGPTVGAVRVLRGAGWGNGAVNCSTAYRGGIIPSDSGDYVGFRSVLPSGQ